MPQDIKGKSVLITGAGAGIGRECALEFARLGAKVAVVDMNEQAAGAVVDEVRALGAEGLPVVCNITDETQVEAMVKTVVDAWGSLDCAFNNAGIGADGVRIPYGELVDTDLSVWQKVFAVNMTGTFLCVKHELKQMIAQGSGSIVNSGSIGGLKMAPTFGPYGPSKAGVIALTQLAALEAAPHGVRVNVVCPGPTDDTTLMANSSATHEGEKEALVEHVIPMKKLAKPLDIARAVVWLSSEMSGHTTGQSLSVDGGMHVA